MCDTNTVRPRYIMDGFERSHHIDRSLAVDPTSVYSLASQARLAASLADLEWANAAAERLYNLYFTKDGSPAEQTEIIKALVLCSRLDLLANICSRKSRNQFQFRLEFDFIQGPIDSISFMAENEKICRIAIHADLLTLSFCEILIERFIYVLPIIIFGMRFGIRPGSFYLIQLGDVGAPPCLNFCSTFDEGLIPDASFLQNLGYVHMRQHFMRRSIPWNDRSSRVFWRGLTTGNAHVWNELPRFKLCTISKELKYREIMDVSFSGVAQLSEDASIAIHDLGLISQHVPMENFDTYRYHIDIDGNTNSWPGLFVKLLSGSPVLKVASAGGFRQWYYDRLVPWYNYIPIREDMSDLDYAIDRMLSDERATEQIGRAGQQLAFSMDYAGGNSQGRS